MKNHIVGVIRSHFLTNPFGRKYASGELNPAKHTRVALCVIRLGVLFVIVYGDTKIICILTELSHEIRDVLRDSFKEHTF